jgi:hypothetical protein
MPGCRADGGSGQRSAEEEIQDRQHEDRDAQQPADEVLAHGDVSCRTSRARAATGPARNGSRTGAGGVAEGDGSSTGAGGGAIGGGSGGLGGAAGGSPVSGVTGTLPPPARGAGSRVIA